MTTSLAGFNAAAVDPNFGGAGFFPVSDEKGHLVIIVADNGFKAASSQQGQYLELMLKCQEGPYAGREAPLRLNLQHTSTGAVAAAQAQLSALCHVTGVMSPGSTLDLMNRPFRVVSELQDAKKPEGYTQLANNGIRNVNGDKPGAKNSGPAPSQTAPAQPSGPAPGGFGAPAGAPQGGAPGWGGAPAGVDPNAGQMQPQQTAPAGAPAWGGAPQGQAPAQGGAPAWGGAPAAGGAPAWGQ